MSIKDQANLQKKRSNKNTPSAKDAAKYLPASAPSQAPIFFGLCHKKSD